MPPDMEESWLKWMVEQNKRDDSTIRELAHLARECVWWYEQDGDEGHLLKAEAYTELVTSFKVHKYSIKQIREQRERVQWAKKKARLSLEQHQS